MKYFKYSVLISFLTLIVSGCSSLPPVQSLSLDKHSINKLGKSAKVGIVSTKTPEISTSFPGADCLLCIAVARGSHTGLIDHVASLTSDVDQLDNLLLKKLQDQGVNVVLISEDFNMKSVSKIETKAEQLLAARLDFRPLAKKYGLTHVLVLNIYSHGVIRDYSSYVPKSEPYASMRGKAYMIDIESNQYVWNHQIDKRWFAAGVWKTPPHYEELTNSYYSTIESVKDDVLEELTIEAAK